MPVRRSTQHEHNQRASLGLCTVGWWDRFCTGIVLSWLLLYIGLCLKSTMYRRERHSVTDLKIHLVCVTKYRKPVFTDKSLKLIEESFRTVAAKMNFQVLEFNGKADHVHVLIEYPPK